MKLAIYGYGNIGRPMRRSSACSRAVIPQVFIR